MLYSEPPRKPHGESTFSFDLWKESVNEYRESDNFDKEYNQFLAKKQVVLVGPSPSLEGEGQGQFIDEMFDLVARVNRGYPVSDNTKDIGSKTDIHYHCFHESPKCGGKIYYKEMTEDGIYVCCPYPRYVKPFNIDVERFETNKGSLRSHYIDTRFYLKMAQSLTTRPNSGIGAILDILAHDVDKLYVTGFTFFQDGWRKGYKDDRIMEKGWKKAEFSGTHIQKPQMDLVRELHQNDTRIIIDDSMTKILEL